eukprot:scaffold2801_cov161-Ochromonas_danica.AAC.18
MEKTSFSIDYAKTFPFGRTDQLIDGADLNLIGGSDYDSDHDHSVGCIIMSFTLQLALLSREAWILTLSVDLVTSMTNPFSSHTSSQRKYHIFVWLLALAGAVALANHTTCQGEFLRSTSNSSTLAMQHVVAYMVACRGFFDGLLWFLTHGFQSSQDSLTNFTLQRRRLSINHKLTMDEILRPWQRVLRLFLKTPTGPTPPDQLASLLEEESRRTSTFRPFQKDGEEATEEAEQTARDQSVASSVGLFSTAVLSDDQDDSPQLNLALRKEVVDLVTLGIRESVQRLQERDPLHNHVRQSEGPPSMPSTPVRLPSAPSESDSSVNSADPMQVVRLSNSTIGPTIRPTVYFNPSYHMMPALAPPPSMLQSFHYSQSSGRISSAMHGLLSAMGSYWPGEYGVDYAAWDDLGSLRSNHFASFMENGESPVPTPKAAVDNVPASLAPPPAEVVFNLLGTHRFRDFRPATFRKLRRLAGLTEERYLDLVSQPARERLAEGGSGAFFFVCGEGDFVVKTVRHSEAQTLLTILDRYCQHLANHPQSFLVRFLGLHEISLYGNTFTFVIMKNIFPPSVKLNERYDLKGSWINRNAGFRAQGKVATCRHCHESFIDGSSSKCPVVVGDHEPMMTLKDNDMICKIRLYPHHAYEVIDALHRDSDALSEMGVMDYSLLVGVEYARYDVETLRSLQVSPGGYFCPNTPGSITAETKQDQGQEEKDEGQGLQQGTQKYPARVVIAPQAYYFGIIDMLETWSWSKKLERWFKVYILGQDGRGVSCVAPGDYCTRFQRKVTQIIEHAVFAREVTGSWQGRRVLRVKDVVVIGVINNTK